MAIQLDGDHLTITLHRIDITLLVECLHLLDHCSLLPAHLQPTVTAMEAWVHAAQVRSYNVSVCHTFDTLAEMHHSSSLRPPLYPQHLMRHLMRHKMFQIHPTYRSRFQERILPQPRS